MAKHIALGVVLYFAMVNTVFSQTTKTKSSEDEATQKALAYFEQIQTQQFDNFLSSIRPAPLSADLRQKVLSMLPKGDLVAPGSDYVAKLKSLEDVLKYNQRDSVIEIKVLRAHSATAVFLAGAAVLITEPALRLLSAEELQAVVAHELGHEYYWNRFELARQNKDFAKIQELELRCDGIAVIALHRLGVDPKNLITAITKLNKYNDHPESLHYVGLNERIAFIHSVIQLVSNQDLRTVLVKETREVQRLRS